MTVTNENIAPKPPQGAPAATPSPFESMIIELFKGQSSMLERQSATLNKLVKLQEESTKEQREAAARQQGAMERQQAVMERQQAVMERHEVAMERQREAMEWQREAMERQREATEKQTATIGNLLNAQERILNYFNVGPARLSANNTTDITDPQFELRTPENKCVGQIQSLQAVLSTPMDHVPRSKNTHEGYVDVGRVNDHAFDQMDIDSILKFISSEWRTAFENQDTCASNTKSIIRKLKAIDPGHGDVVGNNDEKVYQDKLNKLMTIIDQHAAKKAKKSAGLTWKDTHLEPMSNGRKPDGILLIKDAVATDTWANVAVSFEVKSDAFSFKAPVLRGQVVTDFRDMAYDQPRRCSLAFTVSRDGNVHLNLCNSSKICLAYLGRLSCNGVFDKDVERVVRFLLVMYEHLPKNDYGFMVPKPRGILEKFCASDIPGFIQPDHDGILKTAQIDVEGITAIYGRRDAVLRSRSWLYMAAVESEDNTIIHQRAILKFNWALHERKEATVHKKVNELNIPYTPQLFDYATIDSGRKSHYAGEVLLIENGGNQVGSFFKSLHRGNYHMAIDIFAGYLHTLLAAATGDEHEYVLHRDLSAGNLLVKDNKPYVIDWGCGLVVEKNNSRTPSSETILGTAPYMGIRVLTNKRKRSILDDLESLFLVFSFCLWEKYGDGLDKERDNIFANMWRGALRIDDMISPRTQWLRNRKTYWSTMCIEDCPEHLAKLADGMYDLLFSDLGIDLDDFRIKDDDIRTSRFKAEDWVKLFADVMDQAKKDGRTGFDHVEALCKYVRETPNCALIPLDLMDIQETPLMKGRKRGASDPDLTPCPKSRKRRL
ncbi:hypothetical protein EV175_003568 [Coemansia sp. RSA 1933]|nr:hypothetical protein EV175_003568 [Coemansia sp. RSA 1933]